MKEKDIDRLFTTGFFSELDIHFARLMVRLSGQEIPELSLASALVSRAVSEGHVCLDLSSIEGRPLVTDDSNSHTLICPELAAWREKLISSVVVGSPGEYCPLILDDRSRLYLYRYWDYENSLAQDLKARAAKEIGDIDGQLLIDGLSRLFERSPCEGPDWQKVAAFMSVVKSLCVISGGPGTGKTTVIAKILALIMQQNGGNRGRVALAAPTGKAAARLEEAIKYAKESLPLEHRIKEAIVTRASTIHRLLGTIPGSPYFQHNAEDPLPVDLVVVDEASMVDLALMSKLVQAMPSHARLILLGDKDQLSSVEAGAVLGDICDTGRIHGFSKRFSDRFQEITGEAITFTPEKGSYEQKIEDCLVQLNKSYRFGTDSGIGAVSRAVNQGNGDLALNLLKGGGYQDIKWVPLPTREVLAGKLRQTVINGYRPYLEAEDPIEVFHLFEGVRILCALRKGPYGVTALNNLAEQVLQEERLIDTEKRWYRGRPVLITRNDYTMGLFNGDIGVILPDPATDHELRAFFPAPDGTSRKFLPIRLPEHETVYAMTVHKSQGSEFDKAVLLLPDRDTPVLTRELIYTGITRARQGVEVWGTEGVFVEAVNRRTLRASGLRDALWGLAV